MFLLAIPLTLSAFTHLWNPIGYPYGPSNDEGIYIRRAMNILEGQGPQESLLYDHPYFAQLFLAGVLGMIGYPHSLHPSLGDVHSIETLWLILRVLTGLLAVVDTFLIYKIAECRYNRTVALIAAILFAVTPLTWIIRRVWLESIQLPFLLCSILFAIHSKKNLLEKNKFKNKQHILLVLLSGISLGLAIFTKIPGFTMIIVVGFLIYKNNTEKLKTLGLWFMPVVLIPLIWPIYAIYVNEFNLWLNGIYFQTHRGAQTLFETIKYDFQIDSILISLGIVGLVFVAIKKDIFPLLWAIPFLALLYYAGFVSYWHLIPLVPILCIASAILIENLWKTINVKGVGQIILFSIISGIGIFVGLLNMTEAMITSDNSSHFAAATFVSQYLYDNANYKNKTILISNPFYSWIPRYVFHLNNYQIIDYYDNIAIKAERVVFIVDPEWRYRLTHHMVGDNMEKNFYLYSKKEIATFDGISIYEYDLQNYRKTTEVENPSGLMNKLVRYNNITSPNR